MSSNREVGITPHVLHCDLRFSVNHSADTVSTVALDMPFLLLPFRPASDPSAARSFIRNFFNPDRGLQLQGDRLSQELLLTEPMVSTKTADGDEHAENFRFFAAS